MVVERQKPIEGSLERPAAGEVLAPKGDAPVLVQDRFLQPLDEAVGPRVPRLGPRDANPEPFAAARKGAFEFLPVVPSECEVKAGQVLL